MDKLIIKKFFTFNEEIHLTVGSSIIPYNLEEISNGYDILMIRPVVAYTSCHVPARITFTEYHNPVGAMRVYSDTDVWIGLFLEVLLVKQ